MSTTTHQIAFQKHTPQSVIQPGARLTALFGLRRLISLMLTTALLTQPVAAFDPAEMGSGSRHLSRASGPLTPPNARMLLTLEQTFAKLVTKVAQQFPQLVSHVRSSTPNGAPAIMPSIASSSLSSEAIGSLVLTRVGKDPFQSYLAESSAPVAGHAGIISPQRNALFDQIAATWRQENTASPLQVFPVFIRDNFWVFLRHVSDFGAFVTDTLHPNAYAPDPAEDTRVTPAAGALTPLGPAEAYAWTLVEDLEEEKWLVLQRERKDHARHAAEVYRAEATSLYGEEIENASLVQRGDLEDTVIDRHKQLCLQSAEKFEEAEEWESAAKQYERAADDNLRITPGAFHSRENKNLEEKAAVLHGRAAEMLEAQGDFKAIACLLRKSTDNWQRSGNKESRTSLFERVLTLLWGGAKNVETQAIYAQEQGDLSKAAALFKEAAEQYECGADWACWTYEMNRGLGDPEKEKPFNEAAALMYAQIAAILIPQADLAWEKGNWRMAAALYDRSLLEGRVGDEELWQVHQRFIEASIQVIQRLGEQKEFEEAGEFAWWTFRKVAYLSKMQSPEGLTILRNLLHVMAAKENWEDVPFFSDHYPASVMAHINDLWDLELDRARISFLRLALNQSLSNIALENKERGEKLRRLREVETWVEARIAELTVRQAAQAEVARLTMPAAAQDMTPVTAELQVPAPMLAEEEPSAGGGSEDKTGEDTVSDTYAGGKKPSISERDDDDSDTEDDHRPKPSPHGGGGGMKPQRKK